MARRSVRPKQDKKMFTRTANRTKKVNIISNMIPRGGIRL